MKIILDDTKSKSALYPFTATRHSADIRIGILTTREKWTYFPQFEVYDDPAACAAGALAENDPPIIFPANIIPSKQWLNEVLAGNQALYDKKEFIETSEVKMLRYPWQIFQYNDWALRKDFEMITSGKQSEPISATNKIINGENIFLESGAIVEHSILNASTGPILSEKMRKYRKVA